MMSIETKLNPEQIAQDFKAQMTGVMDAEEIAKVVAHLTDDSVTAYSAVGNIVGAIFYAHVTVTLDDGGREFTGNAGGIFTPGAGFNKGDIYTSDLNKLLAETKTFQVNSTLVYFNVNFFDGDSNLLGNYQSGAVSVVTGTGGGTGSF